MSPTSYSVVASNAAGSSAASVVTLEVVPSVPTLSYVGSTGKEGTASIPMTVIPTILFENGSPITSCTISPPLSLGLSLNSITCAISGTPTGALPLTTYNVTAHNSLGSSPSASVALLVRDVPAISYIGASGTTGSVNVPMTVTPTTLNSNNSAISNCIISPALATGLSINTTTCVISGTPSGTLASTAYSVTATNAVGYSIASVTLAVNPSVPTISYENAIGTNGTVGQVLSVTPTILNSNGAPITNCTISPALSVGLSLNTSTCVISGTPTSNFSSITYTVTASNAIGSSAPASVVLSVGASAPSLSYVGAGGTNGSVGSALSVTPTSLDGNGSTVTSCTTFPALPAWATINSTTCVISGTPTGTLISTTYSVTATNSVGSSSAPVSLSVAASAPTISYTGATGTTGTVGTLMSVTPTTFNNNGAVITNCTISPGLTVGLSINTSTCVISGTPTGTLSSTTYSVTATNSAGSNTASVSLSVAASIPTLSYIGATGTSGTVGAMMSVTPTTLNNNGAAITNCTISPALTVGLSINTTSCVISGTPTGILDSTSYSVTAINSLGSSAAATVTLSVAATAPNLSYAGATGNNGTAGSSMSVSPTTLNNNGAVLTSCTTSPALSVGLSINSSTCVISGTPTGALTSTTYSVTATNSAGSSAAATITLSVAGAVPTLSYTGATGASGTVGTAMSVTPTTLNNNGAAITNCTISPALTVGLSINTTTCVISGTPSNILGLTTYSVTAVNSVGSSTAASVILSVCPANYIRVPANSTLGVSEFCVSQFEMKNVSGVATSQAASTPWVAISQVSSKSACNALGTGYDLISNPEWITIAREIEKTDSNWSGGSKGVGMLNRGHSDTSPNSALAVTDINDPYIGTDNNSGQVAGSGWEQKRTHALSNGQVIWDFAGNVWEWIDWNLGSVVNSAPTSCAAAWTQFPSVACPALTSANYMPGNPGLVTASLYNSSYGLGQFFGGGGDGGAPLRGGSYSEGDRSGVFTAYINNSPDSTHLNGGYRCVFRPEDNCLSSPSTGTSCTSNAVVILGTLGSDKYMTTPGGCGNIPAASVSGGSGITSYANSDFTPSCTASTDTLLKSWNEGTAMWYDIPTLPNYTTTEGTGQGSSNTDANYGSYNTAQMIVFTSSSEGGYHAAARYCDKLNYGGYTDWYLPNRYELNLFFTNKTLIPGLLITTDGYWSSTEATHSLAWAQIFLFGEQSTGAGKSSGLYTRCVRRY